MKEQLKRPVHGIVELLVDGKYAEVEALTNGVRLTAQEMARAVKDYGRHLVMPPMDGFDLMSVVEVAAVSPPRWSITMPLWTREEGRSDLSVELTLISSEGSYRVELDDIHVL